MTSKCPRGFWFLPHGMKGSHGRWVRAPARISPRPMVIATPTRTWAKAAADMASIPRANNSEPMDRDNMHGPSFGSVTLRLPQIAWIARLSFRADNSPSSCLES
jgi:hypothetical protein